MKLPFRIALRYLFAKKNHNAINIISMISVVGVCIGTMALITVLSVFNGFENLIGATFSSFDPELKVMPVEGKVFSPDTTQLEQVYQLDAIDYHSEVIEDRVLLRYKDRQTPAFLKGVEGAYEKMTGLDTMIVDGQFALDADGDPAAVLGYGLARTLGAGVKFIRPIYIYVPRRTSSVSLINPEQNFNRSHIYPSAFFFISQPKYDDQYCLVPLALARQLFDYKSEVTAVELSLKQGADLAEVEMQVQALLGNGFQVLNRKEQQKDIFKMMEVEKWMTFLILVFITFIASFNVIGSLSMLMLDKKRDIETLRSIGATAKFVRSIFLFEGWMISVFGAIIGLILGALLCWSQMEFGWLHLQGGGSFIISAYPVDLVFTDFIYVFLAISVLGFLVAYYPVKYIVKRYDIK